MSSPDWQFTHKGKAQRNFTSREERGNKRPGEEERRVRRNEQSLRGVWPGLGKVTG